MDRSLVLALFVIVVSIAIGFYLPYSWAGGILDTVGRFVDAISRM